MSADWIVAWACSLQAAYLVGWYFGCRWRSRLAERLRPSSLPEHPSVDTLPSPNT